LEERHYIELFELEDSHWWFRGRRAVLWAMLHHAALPASPEILDAGCGTGRNLAEFGTLGVASGVDPSPEAIGFCRRRGLENVFQAGLEQLPFPDGRFDLMLATDVIEHIDDDRRALAELHRVARPGGQLLITVPAYTWLWSQHDDSHHHKRRYTMRRLRERVLVSGFRPVVASYFNFLLLAPIALVRATARRQARPDGRTDYDLAPKPVARLLDLPMRGEAKLIERGLRFPAGVSIAMLCTRA